MTATVKLLSIIGLYSAVMAIMTTTMKMTTMNDDADDNDGAQL